MTDARVDVQGLNELRSELRKLDLTDQLKDAHYRVASLVVDEAEKKARAIGRMQAKAAESLRATRTQNKAAVSIGSTRYAFALGAEFGAKNYPQFLPWRGSGTNSGYFMWPAIRESRDEVMRLYGDEIERITSDAFPD